ncbi:Nn.00g068680.m01.CDS01 [Neocucurbitaria sp. VM-36]
MANNTRYYFSLPTEAPQRSRSASRRPPLTPSTVSSPCLTTLVPVTSRRDSGSSSSPTKASALLAKVVSSPTTPRGETPAGSPMPSPESRMQSSPTYSSERPKVWRSESERYVRQYRKQDGYISFPDFEKFCESQNAYDQHHEHTAVKT